jgi:transcriptional regulator with XRE-family HTH domain
MLVHGDAIAAFVMANQLIADIGQRIKSRRLELRVPVAKIAQRCNVSRAAVYAWEKGAHGALKGSNLVILANLLKVEPQWLETGSGPKELAPADITQHVLAFYGTLSPTQRESFDKIINHIMNLVIVDV